MGKDKLFIPVTEKEKQAFLYQNHGCFIPGYTGHCPTLRFQYGKPYGAHSKEILRDLRNKGFLQEPKPLYHENDLGKLVLKPINREKDQFRDYAPDYKYKAPKYVLGYTGFIPTMNFRYGKSYGRTVDDSMCDFFTKQKRLKENRQEFQNYSIRAASAPKIASIRSKDEVMMGLTNYEEHIKYQDRVISPECPPIAGYTGHIPRVKGNEESLANRYNTVVKRGLTLLKQDREKRKELRSAEKKITTIFKDANGRYSFT